MDAINKKKTLKVSNALLVALICHRLVHEYPVYFYHVFSLISGLRLGYCATVPGTS